MEKNEKKPNVDYVAIIREFEHYGRGRSLRKFCTENGYVYQNVVRHYRRYFWDMKTKMSSFSNGSTDSFVPFELEATEPASDNMGSVPPVTSSGSSAPLRCYSIVSLHVSFSNGMELSLCETDVNEITALLHKIVG